MTYIYQTINESQFIDAFRQAGRKDQFSYKALQALYEYYEELANDTGEPFELDVIAICCDWAEFKDIEEFKESYGEEYESLDDIRDATHAIELDDGSFLALQF